MLINGTQEQDLGADASELAVGNPRYERYRTICGSSYFQTFAPRIVVGGHGVLIPVTLTFKITDLTTAKS